MIEIRNITKIYETAEGKTQALDNVSFAIEDGLVFGIIGMSGAGKSTLMNILTGLVKPTRGEILLDGDPFDYADEAALRRLRQSIGVVFQGYHLLMQKNVFDNIAFPLVIQGWEKSAIGERVATLIEEVGLSGKEKHYPAQLSGGQKQRVAIARALANRPKLLLLDEPTSALDSLTTKEIIELLKRINAEDGVTMLVITHEMNVARILSHKMLVIDRGRCVEAGLTAELFTRPRHEITKLLIGKEV